MEKPDFYNLIAHERGAPPEWRWVSIEGVGEDRETGAALVKGAVYRTALKRGPRRGMPNLRNPEPGTQREILITFKEYDERAKRWTEENATT